jgi:hypothetical protein
MNKTIAYCILIATTAVLLVISVARADMLSDANEFLRGFVNQELLNILGVILAITLASTANIHLAFNRIEERHNAPGSLEKSRRNLKKATYWLIGLFIAAAIGVVLKPLAASTPTGQAIFNSGALVILLWQVLILVSLTQLVFLIEPEFPELGNPDPDPLPEDDEGAGQSGNRKKKK